MENVKNILTPQPKLLNNLKYHYLSLIQIWSRKDSLIKESGKQIVPNYPSIWKQNTAFPSFATAVLVFHRD